MKRGREIKGFTLLEALMAMVILGLAAGGVLLPFVSAAQVQKEATRQVIAAKLASDLIEQIHNTNYAGVIGTWNGYTESTGQVRNAVGILFTDPVYKRFGRSVTCQTATVAGVNLIWVTVTVTCDGREMMKLSSLIGP
jgi:prepilin-type N-terminal cleavage/methylation domain-containing protein